MRVELPFLAEGVEGGDVVQVLVKEGDQVTEGQSLIELETDKATVPVPAPSAGTVTHLLVKKGDHLKGGAGPCGARTARANSAPQKTAASKAAADKPAAEKSPDKKPAQPSWHSTPGYYPCGAVILCSAVRHRPRSRRRPSRPRMPRPSRSVRSRRRQSSSSPASSASGTKPASPAEQAAHAGPSESPSPGASIAAPPSVRRLARELGVDLTQVPVSEAGGRITAEDVKTYVRERTRRSGRSLRQGRRGERRQRLFDGLWQRTPGKNLLTARKIAATVTQAWTTIPHVHQFQDADITDLHALHKRYAPLFKQKGATLTLTSLFLKAVTHALKLYPQFNATLDLTNGEVIYKEYYNIGVAVDTPDGLIVPVVHHVDQKDLLQISLELADLAERTRTRKVKLEELRGATFSVSNMGGLGAGPFTPIVIRRRSASWEWARARNPGLS